MTGKPCCERFSRALAAIAPITTMSETGKFGANRRPSRMQATTEERKPEQPRIEHRLPLQNLPKLDQRSARGDVHAQHVAEHRRPDLNADAGQKPDQRRAGQKVGKKSELEDARQHKKAGSQQRNHADQRHVMFAGRRRHPRKRTRKNRRGRRIRRDNEMTRRPEDREGDERQKDRVEAGHDRRSGDARIAEDLRNVHRRQRHPGEGVAQGLPRLDRPQASEDRNSHLLRALASAWISPGGAAQLSETARKEQATQNFLWSSGRCPVWAACHNFVTCGACVFGRRARR